MKKITRLSLIITLFITLLFTLSLSIACSSNDFSSESNDGIKYLNRILEIEEEGERLVKSSLVSPADYLDFVLDSSDELLEIFDAVVDDHLDIADLALLQAEYLLKSGRFILGDIEFSEYADYYEMYTIKRDRVIKKYL